MKFGLALLSGLLATTVTGLAIPKPEPEAEPVALPEAAPEPSPVDEIITRAASDADILKNSALAWYARTTIVSTFLDLVATKKFTSQTAFVIAAKAAWLAESEEWDFKEILATYLVKDQGCQASNSTLSDGDTWSNVKELLFQLTELNWKTDQAKIQELLKQINFGDGVAKGRCSTILPAFDVYFAGAAKKLKTLRKGDTSLDRLRTVRPRCCSSAQTRAVPVDVMLEAEMDDE